METHYSHFDSRTSLPLPTLLKMHLMFMNTAKVSLLSKHYWNFENTKHSNRNPFFYFVSGGMWLKISIIKAAVSKSKQIIHKAQEVTY